MRRVKALATMALVSSTVLVMTPNVALADSCLSAPPLASAPSSTSLSLGSGVTAKSWTWAPGSQAENASLSPLGTKVSVVEGNLRSIDFGVLHEGIPTVRTLKSLSEANPRAIASINGDYFDFDTNIPWNAMIEAGTLTYSPSSETGVIGMAQKRVDPARGYRTTGTLTVATKKFSVTGVNQLSPGAESMVVYLPNSYRPVPPKGNATVLIKNGKIYRVYPNGAAINVRSGTVIQARGAIAKVLGRLKLTTKIKLVVANPPQYETRIAADKIKTIGTIANSATTMMFDAVNYKAISANGATVFDTRYTNTPTRARTTLRIGKDELGRQVIKNVYVSGAGITAGSGELVVQANGNAATLARRFRAGDLVTVKYTYQAEAKTTFITAAGRGPRLVQNSKFVWICSQHSKEFRPRTAIGWDQDGKIWLITSSRGQDAADFGYRQGGSTADQIGHWLQSLGATDAILLDGGGSTTMVINNPASSWQRFDIPDSGWYRDLASGYALLTKD
jgi:hypothetical protein